jgi:predicted Fe-Mo cluster-binding NifX family protein
MKVAVPVFGEEVSPRFGCSTHAVIAIVDQDGVRVEGQQDLSQAPPWQWPELFASLGVTKVICGGVHPRFQQAMHALGIDVIWGVIGPAAEALVALQDGRLRSDQFLGRGGRRHRHGRRGRMGHGPASWSRGGPASRGRQFGRGAGFHGRPTA